MYLAERVVVAHAVHGVKSVLSLAKDFLHEENDEYCQQRIAIP